MLNLVKSNRMEHLVRALCATLEAVPSDPMAAEWIGIQSRGMKQWLTTTLAKHFGICANVEFLFPRQILERILDKNRAPGRRAGEKGPVLSREVMTWAVMRRLASPDAWPSPLSGTGGPLGYVADDPEGRKLWQLSRNIARVFDDYQVYRPDLLDRWAGPGAWEQEDRETGAAWQAWLWQDLVQAGQPLLSGIQGMIQGQRLSNTGGVPGRICLFGVSAMPPRFLEAFNALGRTLDIVIFLLTPSDQFFYDLASDRQLQKQAVARGDEPGITPDEAGSPLLRALGKSGRDFHGVLENFDYHEPFGDLFEDPAEQGDMGNASMLEVLQSDILTLTGRGRDLESPPLAVAPGDSSISLHACHSPMREAQVLKDRILDIMVRDPGIAPHDIIVMMPDIEAYAPFLEAVFSQEPRLPYTVSDRKRRSESRTVEAFLSILDLRGSRLEKSRVMELLLFPAVADRFGIPAGDLERINSALTEARVFWGKDQSHRERVSGMAFEENTWTFGLSRLLMGTALPAGEEALAGPVLPCDGFEGLESEVLGRFAHFASTLFKGLDSLEARQTVEGWGRTLRRIIRSMMADDGQGDMAFLLTALDECCREGEAAGATEKVAFSVMAEALTDKLDQSISQGSFMAGSITFCNLMPMRSIPFKVVCLMGMDEKGFPRQAREPMFNLMARFPRAGDKQVREEDCYLFLESLMSARSRMVMTYTGMSISDNSPIPCAGPVAVLKDTMAKSFDWPKGSRWIVSHPLHPFSAGYFDPAAPDLFSYSLSQCEIAAAQEKMRAAGQGQGSPSLLTGGSGEKEPPREPVEIDGMIRFFRRPAETFIQKCIGLRFPRIAEAEQDRECFQVSGLAQYSLGTVCLDRGEDPGLFARLKAAGRLPLGRKGEVEWQRIRTLSRPVADLADSLFPPGEAGSLGVNLRAGGLDFTGRVPDLFDRGRYVKTFGKPTPDRLLTQWIYHLFYCAAVPIPKETWLAAQDPKGPAALAVGFSSLDSKKAMETIETLVGLYTDGMTRGLAFACTPCFRLVESLAKQGFDLDTASLEAAVKLARPFWTGGFFQQGEITDRYTAFVFGDLDPFSGVEALRNSGMLDAGLSVFRPMMEAMI